MINENFKLGKLPTKLDPRTLHLENYILPEPPIQRIWSAPVSDYEMLGNDEAGDCGPVGWLHSVQTMTANATAEVRFTKSEAFELYTQLTGFNPATGNNDTGVVLLDMLKFLRNVGYKDHKIGAFVSVNARNIRMVKTAINEFGGVLTGFALPISVQNKSRWDIGSSFNGIGMPGSWGGHCTYIPDFLQNNDFPNVTWGGLLPASDKFVQVYCDEMYAILSRDFINDKNLAPNNFDWDKLTFDLNHIN